MLRSNYRYSRDHRNYQSQPPLSPPTVGGGGGGSPISNFFDELDTRHHRGLSSLGRRARDGFRRCQTTASSGGGGPGGSFGGAGGFGAGGGGNHEPAHCLPYNQVASAEMSRSFDLAAVGQLQTHQNQQQHQHHHHHQYHHAASVGKLVRLLGQEVTSDDKILFDHFFDRGRRNASANIFCGLSSRGLRRLFAVYGIDEVQTKPPPPQPSSPSPMPLSPHGDSGGSSILSNRHRSQGHGRTRGEKMLLFQQQHTCKTNSLSSMPPSRTGSVERSHRNRSGWQLFGCGQSSSADESNDPPARQSDDPVSAGGGVVEVGSAGTSEFKFI